MTSWRERLKIPHPPNDYDEAYTMPLWMLLILIPLPGVSDLYASQVLEVYGTQRDCYEALSVLEVKAVCVEVK